MREVGVGKYALKQVKSVCSWSPSADNCRKLLPNFRARMSDSKIQSRSPAFGIR